MSNQIRFVARVVSISESDRLHHRRLGLDVFATPVAEAEQDPFGCHHHHLMVQNGHVFIDVPSDKASDLHPGKFIAFELSPVTAAEQEQINDESRRRATANHRMMETRLAAVYPYTP